MTENPYLDLKIVKKYRKTLDGFSAVVVRKLLSQDCEMSSKNLVSHLRGRERPCHSSIT